MMKTRILALLGCAALLAGCFKDTSYDTTYVLKPLVQPNSVDPVQPLEGVQAYTYAVDTLLWGISSYEDALAGVITLKGDPSQQMTTPAAVAVPYDAIEGAVGWLQMPVGEPFQMIVAVDPASRIYGYTVQPQILNLPELFVSLVFKPWKEGFSYKDGNWSFYNDFYVPPVTLKTYIAPKLQQTEGGPESDPVSSQVKAYAYAADTTQWYIASYEDARDFRITLKDDPKQTRTQPNFRAYHEDSGLYGMDVTSTPLMVVVVDLENQLYAYSKQEVELSGPEVTFPVVFRLWSKEWITVENGWRVVNDALRPEQNPEPETPVTPESIYTR
ncbi:hypothetical protein [Alistipes sp.]|uniref:hypothetical protein n=1 Tax=Alistipes sp. TaxID=1872444 RepID=UPI003AF15256